MTTKMIATDALQQSAGREDHKEILELIEAYAEARHIGGCHTYNAKTAEARAKVVAALTAAPQGGAYAELADNLQRAVNQTDADDDVIHVARWFVEDAIAALRASHGQAPADPDGEAFRTAAHLGLTLRFYGGCAQSSMPGTPSAYVVVTCRDRAAGMREAVQRAATVIENGGESQRLDTTTAQPAPAAFQRALDIRAAQGWKLGGDKVPVLYTDSINGEQVCRDDLWLCTTAALAADAPAAGAVAGPGVDMPSPWRAAQYSGYDTQYWTIKRRNPAWRGGTEIGMNGNCNPRRFKTEAAAQKAADELNAAAPTPAAPVDEDGERYRHLIETLDDQTHGKPTLGAAWDDDIGFWTKGSFFGLKDKASIDAAIDAERAALAQKGGA